MIEDVIATALVTTATTAIISIIMYLIAKSIDTAVMKVRKNKWKNLQFDS